MRRSWEALYLRFFLLFLSLFFVTAFLGSTISYAKVEAWGKAFIAVKDPVEYSERRYLKGVLPVTPHADSFERLSRPHPQSYLDGVEVVPSSEFSTDLEAQRRKVVEDIIEDITEPIYKEFTDFSFSFLGRSFDALDTTFNFNLDLIPKRRILYWSAPFDRGGFRYIVEDTVDISPNIGVDILKGTGFENLIGDFKVGYIIRRRLLTDSPYIFPKKETTEDIKHIVRRNHGGRWDTKDEFVSGLRKIVEFFSREFYRLFKPFVNSERGHLLSRDLLSGLGFPFDGLSYTGSKMKKGIGRLWPIGADTLLKRFGPQMSVGDSYSVTQYVRAGLSSSDEVLTNTSVSFGKHRLYAISFTFVKVGEDRFAVAVQGEADTASFLSVPLISVQAGPLRWNPFRNTITVRGDSKLVSTGAEGPLDIKTNHLNWSDILKAQLGITARRLYYYDLNNTTHRRALDEALSFDFKLSDAQGLRQKGTAFRSHYETDSKTRFNIYLLKFKRRKNFGVERWIDFEILPEPDIPFREIRRTTRWYSDHETSSRSSIPFLLNREKKLSDLGTAHYYDKEYGRNTGLKALIQLEDSNLRFFDVWAVRAQLKALFKNEPHIDETIFGDLLKELQDLRDKDGPTDEDFYLSLELAISSRALKRAIEHSKTVDITPYLEDRGSASTDKEKTCRYYVKASCDLKKVFSRDNLNLRMYELMRIHNRATYNHKARLLGKIVEWAGGYNSPGVSYRLSVIRQKEKFKFKNTDNLPNTLVERDDRPNSDPSPIATDQRDKVPGFDIEQEVEISDRDAHRRHWTLAVSRHGYGKSYISEADFFVHNGKLYLEIESKKKWTGDYFLQAWIFKNRVIINNKLEGFASSDTVIPIQKRGRYVYLFELKNRKALLDLAQKTRKTLLMQFRIVKKDQANDRYVNITDVQQIYLLKKSILSNLLIP